MWWPCPHITQAQACAVECSLVLAPSSTVLMKATLLARTSGLNGTQKKTRLPCAYQSMLCLLRAFQVPAKCGGHQLWRLPRRHLAHNLPAYRNMPFRSPYTTLSRKLRPTSELPLGSKDPYNRVSGPKYYNINGIWALKPHYLGPWTLRAIVRAKPGQPSTFGVSAV